MIDNYFKPEHENIFSSCHLTSVVLASFQVWMFLVFVCWMAHTSSSTPYDYRHRTFKGRGEIVKVDSSCWVRSILFPSHISVCTAMFLPVYGLNFSLLFYIFSTFHTAPFKFTSHNYVCIAMLLPSILHFFSSLLHLFYISHSPLPIHISQSFQFTSRTVWIAMLIPSILHFFSTLLHLFNISPSLYPVSISHCLYWRREAHLISAKRKTFLCFHPFVCLAERKSGEDCLRFAIL